MTPEKQTRLVHRPGKAATDLVGASSSQNAKRQKQRQRSNDIMASTVPVHPHLKPDITWLVSLPRRLQTPEERRRTELFRLETIELLELTAPHFSHPFNRFIPAYHHHFGRQCRVSDYGCNKLVDLIELIPDCVQVRLYGPF
ncbi:unnamed protein product [Protopolystoma xenopodis]|uniref:HTH OST-type domain-containing protein n=1 Tax=Protopolystoma xenopodis TaxID=117903 RepID=A0A3S5AEC2_9PLAT|nr:unnamed protein product [Protopolystoma xenopodis]